MGSTRPGIVAWTTVFLLRSRWYWSGVRLQWLHRIGVEVVSKSAGPGFWRDRSRIWRRYGTVHSTHQVLDRHSYVSKRVPGDRDYSGCGHRRRRTISSPSRARFRSQTGSIDGRQSVDTPECRTVHN